MATAEVTYEKDTVPANLPIGNVPAVTQAEIVEEVLADSITEENAEMKDLENHAHEQHVLLSSDAMRHLLATSRDMEGRLAFLDKVILDAKNTYPSEDGWMVINLERMQSLCEHPEQHASSEEDVEDVSTFVPAAVVLADKFADTPVGIGSLAEAIVSGNVQAALQMTKSRPMVALADAAADFDAVYRMRQGNYVADSQASEMLKTHIKNLSDKQLEETIMALTGSIDGTYTDEKAAVKVAVMNAISVVTK